uniref:Uncharacterized protein n=1 Tax=Arundo donax TaxID=35708 RepID=A0A0A9HEL2_ARUDO
MKSRLGSSIFSYSNSRNYVFMLMLPFFIGARAL